MKTPFPIVVAALVASSAYAVCPTRSTPWPKTSWPDAKAATATAKAAQIKALEDEIFKLTGTDGERLGFRTDGMVIIKGGQLIYEKYARGFDETKRHLSWSVAKSYSSVLLGVAVKQGAITLDDSICTYLTEYAGKDVCKIKVKNVANFTSGLAWQEGYEDEPYRFSSVISMFFGAGHRDQLAHILSHKLIAEPGTKWLYSTGDASLDGTIVKRALEAKGFGKDAFWTLLFDKIGTPSVVLEEDVKGTVQGGSHLYATPRDFAKLGYLMLNDGCIDGERILPEDWVKDSTTVTPAFKTLDDANETLPSGYSWWLNQPVPERSLPKSWADAPEDAYAALGHWGQRIIVVPSLDLVIVRTGDDRQGSIDPNILLKHAIEVAR